MSDGERNYDLQIRLVKEAMTALGADIPHKGTEIKQWVTEKYPAEFTRLANSWSTYMTAITQRAEGGIERTPGRYTFFLRKVDATAQQAGAEEAAAVQPPEEKEPTQRKQREQLLYPAVAAWLSARGFPAEVSASTKKGGIWGNPDVTGIKIVDTLLGGKHIEVSTVEAKLSAAYWRYYFFEAVAHKRFAHRAYFAFAVGSDEPSIADLDGVSELREYGEKYGVGLLAIFIPSEDYKNLVSGADPKIDDDAILIQEIWPAIHDPVSPSAVSSFLRDVLELADDRSLYEYGGTDRGA